MDDGWTLTCLFDAGFVQYKFDYDSEGELPDVEKYNYKSFTAQVEAQLWEEGTKAYMKTDGRYYCKFHTAGMNVPRDGLRTGLLAHVRAVASGAGAKNLREQGHHAALLSVLTQYELICISFWMNV